MRLDAPSSLDSEYAKLDGMLSQLNKEQSYGWWTSANAMTISSVVLGFGLLVLFLATYLLKSGRSPESILRIFGTILIIVASIFLVVAGYSNNQIAPVMGLLGTIAGYLLGKEEKTAKAPPN